MKDWYFGLGKEMTQLQGNDWKIGRKIGWKMPIFIKNDPIVKKKVKLRSSTAKFFWMCAKMQIR